MSQTEPKQGKKDKNAFKDTLNLPKTSFPMRANLVQNEPASIKRWEKQGAYAKVMEARVGATPFVFHDGPPYANGSIHLGHLLNKCLKDFVVRSQLLAGKACPFVPGWDCHGLPIEHKVMQELADSGKLAKLESLEEDVRRMAIRRECQKYAQKFVKQQMGEMKRLLTLADYDDPYVTMKPEYEGAVLEVFASMVEQGIVYRQLKAVHWSPENETALADAELEYYDREDISVYVDFEAADAAAVYEAFNVADSDDGDDDDDSGRPGQTPCFMIWTTTPWTLPANLAIAVNEKFIYALCRVDGNVTVLAKELVEKVTKLAKADNVEVLAEAPGSALVGLRYKHPFVEGGPDFASQPDAAMVNADPAGVYRVVAADYVTLEDGTGLVHTAPGHGSDDYLTGLREKLPIYCPVNPKGIYDHSVPKWLEGQEIWVANTKIVKHLRDAGHLFFSHTFEHSYPHDWRGKTPVIFRATEQWFVGVEREMKSTGKTMRDLALAETAHDVRFVPEWGKNRLRGMLETRPDWCISRQRSWGLPIPAFRMADGEVLLTPASVRAVARAFREEGSDSWFEKDPAHLLRHYDPSSDPDAPAGVDTSALTKLHDIFDVWFESGSSWNAVMRERCGDDAYPIDLYLEGSDQHRGWFQLSLLCGLGATGKPPFRTLLTHGFCVDKDGKKMSKSLGNALNVADLMRDFGADVCRWWVAATPYEHDIKTDFEFFKTAGESYRKVRNTLRFLLSNLADFEPSPAGKDCSSGEGMCIAIKDYPPTSIDAWVLSEFDKVSADVRAAYDNYHFQKAVTRLYNFCNDTLSAVYLAAVKDRLYCDKPDSPRRRRTQSTLWDLTDGLCRLLAPILPHTAEEARTALTNGNNNADADTNTPLQARTFIESFDAPVDPDWHKVMEARDEALQAMERVRALQEIDNPLDMGVTLPDPDGALARFDPVDLADLLGVSRVALGGDEVKIENLSSEPRCERSWKRDGTVREREGGAMLSDRDAEAVAAA